MSSLQQQISKLQITSRLTLILVTTLLLTKPLESTVQAQPAPEVMLD